MSDSRQGETRPKFSLGRVLATQGAVGLLQRSNVDIPALISRHVHGDWGLVHPDDIETNERAVREGHCIMSIYALAIAGSDSKTEALWLITEADRTSTTFLLPGEY
ncbi:MAG: hypothetical protein V4731_15040 [Pseudomonadota bacterium]